MTANTLLLSVHPKYADMIIKGTKRVELRRVRPRVKQGDWVLVYASSPLQALIGAFRVEQIVASPPQSLWTIVQSIAGITREEFDEYYAGASISFGIFFSEVFSLSEPIRLCQLKEIWPGFYPPQGYQYLPSPRANSLLLKVAEHIDVTAR